MSNIYTVWFKGNDVEDASIAYAGRRAFHTTDPEHAARFVEELEDSFPQCKGLYVVKQLIDVKE